MNDKIIVPKYLLDIVCSEYNVFVKLMEKKYFEDLENAPTFEMKREIGNEFFNFLSWISKTIVDIEQNNQYPFLGQIEQLISSFSSADDLSLRSSITSGYLSSHKSSDYMYDYDDDNEYSINTLPL